LQLIRYAALVLFVLLLASFARADDTFTAKTQVYADSDHTVVVSPLIAISRDAWKGGTVNASYVADVVSSASIDVVSNATTHMSDFRSEITAGVAQKWRASTFSGSYIYSVENDYSSHNVNLGVAQDFFQRNTTLALGWTVSQNAVRRTGDQEFHRSLFVTGIAATWTQTLTKKLIGQLSYTFTYDDGYQASPYRFVPVTVNNGLTTQYKVPESMPLTRYRNAFVLGLNQHVFSDSAIQGDYRYYFDNWGLQSHTIQLRYLINWKDVTLRLRERFYYQRGVSFYEPHYDEVQPFMTTDRESSTFWSNLAGLKISWRLPFVHRALELEAKGDVLYIKYINYPLLPYRVGGTGELGLNVIY
jgi:Protein of unknown function (DUF3570)